MINEALVRRAKEIAAQKACTAYSEAIQTMLREEKIPLIEALHGTEHVHTALLFEGNQAVAIRCSWEFTADPDIIRRGIDQAKAEGKM